MTSVSVKESAQSPARSALMAPAPAPPRRFTWRKRIFYSLVGAAIVVLLFHFIIMPWMLRDRVRAALAAAGFRNVQFTVARATLWGAELRNVKFGDKGDSVARAQIGYQPDDLWEGKIDSLRLSGLHYSISLEDQPARQTRSSASRLELPIRQIEVVDSTIVLVGDPAVRIPLQASLERKENEYEISVTAGEGAALASYGTIAPSFNSGSITANLHALSGELVSRVVRMASGGPDLALRGKLDGSVIGRWEDDAFRVAGEIKLSGGEEASEDKLSITAGVFSGEAEIGPATRPSLSLEVSGVDITTDQLSADGVAGEIELSSLSPPATPRPQKMSAEKVTIGDMELRNGEMEFSVTEAGETKVHETSWHWLGGELSASDFVIPGDGPLSLTVNLRDVELSEVLELLAEEKASGQGKLTGQLPVTIDGSKVTFGNGVISSMRGGTVQIKDADVIAPAATAAQQAAPAGASKEQIQRDIVEALSDFEYDRLTGRLVNDEGGLSAYIRMSGHGRTGAQQGLDYELRVHGLDAVLRGYLGVRQMIDAREHKTGKAGT